MTQPVPETLDREKDKLYVTEAELIRRLGVPRTTAKPILRELEDKHGFPRPERLWGGRRYWPAVKAWLDKHYGLSNGNNS